MVLSSIATGRLSRGGYIGPTLVLVARPGFQTVVVDQWIPPKVWDVRVVDVTPEYAIIECKTHGTREHWRPANRVPRVPIMEVQPE